VGEVDGDVIDEGEIEEIGEISRIRTQKIKDEDKGYNVNIQKGDLYNYKLQENPGAAKNDILAAKILRDVNMIMLLYETSQGDNVGTTLEARYERGDYKNAALVPIVTNKKKIYISTQNEKRELDPKTNEIIEDFYADIKKPIYDRDYSGIQINYESRILTLLNEINPTISISGSGGGGHALRVGGSNNKNPIRMTTPDNVAILDGDITVIRQCDGGYKCQSIALQSIKGEYGIALGGVGNYIFEEDSTESVMRSDDYRSVNILHVGGNYRIIYPGDMINIVGWVRLPLKRNNINELGAILNEVEMVELDPDELDDDFKYDNTKGYMCMLEDGLAIKQLIPTVADILAVHGDENVYDIISELARYEYNMGELSGENMGIVMRYINGGISKSAGQVSDIIEMRHISAGAGAGAQSQVPFRVITEEIYKEMESLYGTGYSNSNRDGDAWRINWLNGTIDNGRYFYIWMRYRILDEYMRGMNVDKLAIEIDELRSKRLVAESERANYMATMGPSGGGINNVAPCAGASELDTANIIKYPTLERLEEDNYHTAYDTSGAVIKSGDYGLIVNMDATEAKSRYQIYKRESVGGKDIWIRENIDVLHEIIAHRKSRCERNKLSIMDTKQKELMSGAICMYDVNTVRCRTKREIMLDMEVDNLAMEIERREGDMRYAKELPRLLSEIKRDMDNARDILLEQLEIGRVQREHQVIKERELKELNDKLVIRPRECVHYGIMDEFNRRNDDLYISAEMRIRMMGDLLDKLMETETHVVKLDKIDEREDANYVNCNICNQRLMCKHYVWCVTNMRESETGMLDYDKLVRLYGYSGNQAYRCRICEELIKTEDVLDVEDFESGENGNMIKTRDIWDGTRDVDNTKQETLNKLFLEMGAHDEYAMIKKEIYLSLLMLCGLVALDYGDEVEMLTFLRGNNFITQADIATLLKASGAYASLAEQQRELHINRLITLYMGCDIAARLLIMIQTSQSVYNVRNAYCVSNIMGYPLINDVSELNGVNFMVCIMNQLAMSNKRYEVFRDSKLRDKFIERIRRQADDAYIRVKLLSALTTNATALGSALSFIKYHTNEWADYRPSLCMHSNTKSGSSAGDLVMRTLGADNLGEISVKTYDTMVSSGLKYVEYESGEWQRRLNSEVDTYELENTKYRGGGIGNSCNGVYVETYSAMYENTGAAIIKKMAEATGVLRRLEELRCSVGGLNNLVHNLTGRGGIELSLIPEGRDVGRMYEQYIDAGVYSGEEHVYNEYGRCILSNQMRSDIRRRNYRMDDYVRLMEIIVKKQEIPKSRTELQRAKPVDKSEVELLDKLIARCGKERLNFVVNVCKSVKEYVGGGADASASTKEKKYNVYKYVSMVENQLHEEIAHLVSKIASTNETDRKRYANFLTNLGDFVDQRGEYQDKLESESGDMGEVNKFRYRKKYDYMCNVVNYWYKVVSILGSNLLGDSISEISAHYDLFKEYGDSPVLFEQIRRRTASLVELIREIGVRTYYKYITIELMSNIAHYIFVRLMLDTIEYIEDRNPRHKEQMAESLQKVEKRPKYSVTDDGELNIVLEPAMAMTGGASESNWSADPDESKMSKDVGSDHGDMDMIKEVLRKNSKQLEMIIKFTKSFIKKVSDEQHKRDIITIKYIEEKSTIYLQKTQQLNLGVMAIIQPNEEERQIIMMKMKLGLIKWADLLKEYKDRHRGDVDYKEENVDKLALISPYDDAEYRPDVNELYEEDPEEADPELGQDLDEEQGYSTYIGDDNDADSYYE
jgi:hypothetical protein